jgi:hypothetical protein
MLVAVGAAAADTGGGGRRKPLAAFVRAVVPEPHLLGVAICVWHWRARSHIRLVDAVAVHERAAQRIGHARSFIVRVGVPQAYARSVLITRLGLGRTRHRGHGAVVQGAAVCVGIAGIIVRPA